MVQLLFDFEELVSDAAMSVAVAGGDTKVVHVLAESYRKNSNEELRARVDVAWMTQADHVDPLCHCAFQETVGFDNSRTHCGRQHLLPANVEDRESRVAFQSWISAACLSRCSRIARQLRNLAGNDSTRSPSSAWESPQLLALSTIFGMWKFLVFSCENGDKPASKHRSFILSRGLTERRHLVDVLGDTVCDGKMRIDANEGGEELSGETIVKSTWKGRRLLPFSGKRDREKKREKVAGSARHSPSMNEKKTKRWRTQTFRNVPIRPSELAKAAHRPATSGLSVRNRISSSASHLHRPATTGQSATTLRGNGEAGSRHDNLLAELLSGVENLPYEEGLKCLLAKWSGNKRGEYPTQFAEPSIEDERINAPFHAVVPNAASLPGCPGESSTIEQAVSPGKSAFASKSETKRERRRPKTPLPFIKISRMDWKRPKKFKSLLGTPFLREKNRLEKRVLQFERERHTREG